MGEVILPPQKVYNMTLDKLIILVLVFFAVFGLLSYVDYNFLGQFLGRPSIFAGSLFVIGIVGFLT